MVDLSQIEKNHKVLIKQIHAQSTLKKRLLSLGLVVGKEVEVVETSLQRNTMKVSIGLTAVALRYNEAQLIEVERAK